jgi:hypothetical protein
MHEHLGPFRALGPNEVKHVPVVLRFHLADLVSGDARCRGLKSMPPWAYDPYLPADLRLSDHIADTLWVVASLLVAASVVWSAGPIWVA